MLKSKNVHKQNLKSAFRQRNFKKHFDTKTFKQSVLKSKNVHKQNLKSPFRQISVFAISCQLLLTVHCHANMARVVLPKFSCSHCGCENFAVCQIKFLQNAIKCKNFLSYTHTFLPVGSYNSKKTKKQSKFVCKKKLAKDAELSTVQRHSQIYSIFLLTQMEFKTEKYF